MLKEKQLTPVSLSPPSMAAAKQKTSITSSPLSSVWSNDFDLQSDKDSSNVKEEKTYKLTHQEALQVFSRIENAFNSMKQRIFDEGMAEVEAEEESVRNGFNDLTVGTNLEFVSQLKKMEEQQKDRLQFLLQEKSFQERLAINQFEATVQQLKTALEVGKIYKRKEILEQVYKKKKRHQAEIRKHRACYAPALESHYNSLVQRNAIFQHRRHRQELNEWNPILKVGFPSSSINGLTEEEALQDLKMLSGQTDCLFEPVNNENVLKTCNYPVIDTQTQKPLIVIRGEKLYIRGIPYCKNDKAYLFDNGAKFTVKLINISDRDLTVQRTDGSKTRLSFALLLEGRVTLSPTL
ncbi:hypothetical protein HDV01_002810 [Terramyces sp. JEL0728]|nr:hypothetical protein HDV01_002810 [Terramyces sp. JEL0728]